MVPHILGIAFRDITVAAVEEEQQQEQPELVVLLQVVVSLVVSVVVTEPMGVGLVMTMLVVLLVYPQILSFIPAPPPGWYPVTSWAFLGTLWNFWKLPGAPGMFTWLQRNPEIPPVSRKRGKAAENRKTVNMFFRNFLFLFALTV